MSSMRLIKRSFLVVLIATSFFLTVQASAGGVSMDEQLDNLVFDFGQYMQDIQQRAAQTKDKEERALIQSQMVFGGEKYLTRAQGIYQRAPASNAGFKAMLFALTRPGNVAAQNEVYLLLKEHHLNHDKLHLVLGGRVDGLNFSAERQEFLMTLLEKRNEDRIQGLVLSELAVAHKELTNLVATTAELNLTLDEHLDSLVASFNSVVGPGGSQRHISKEFLLKNLDIPSAKKNMKLDWRELREKAKAYADVAKAKYADQQKFGYQLTQQGLMEFPQGTVGSQVDSVLYELENVLPGARLVNLGATDLNGNAFNLADLKGKVLLLDFWATWCAPCVAAMPHHVEFMGKMTGRPIELVTLSVDSEPQDVLDFIDEDQEMPFTNLFLGIDSPILKQWGIASFPATVVVDQNGIILARPQLTHGELYKYLERVVVKAEKAI